MTTRRGLAALVAVGTAAAMALPGMAVSGARAEAPPGSGPSVAAGSSPSRGIVVRLRPGAGALGVTVAAARSIATEAPPGVTLAGTRTMGIPHTRLMLFSGEIAEADAAAIARSLERRGDVVWAEPDVLAFPQTPPSLPDDPRFAEQWDMWDGGGSADFSVKGPLVWGSTTGSPAVVVAVIDTGSTAHPDLSGTTIPGYDFITQAVRANDGDGRDADPSDTGDFLTADEVAPGGAFAGCNRGREKRSSWHGTHVAGTINALQGNGEGVTGLAPSVKVQHVRVLGKCGGWGSDIADGMVWAAGGAVPGVPATANPAHVLNLSLGGPAVECPAFFADAVNEVLGLGSSIVVAAGNEKSPVSGFYPANCPGVIAVASTDRLGQRSGFSNVGESDGEVALAAPGSVILSTVNSGAQGPGAPGYAFYSGTSMAAPHVAAAASLLYSAGVTDPDIVRARLESAVTDFPTGVPSDVACDTTKCGAGILDVSRLELGAPVAAAPGPPVNLTHTALSETSLTLEWDAPSDDGGSPVATYQVEQRVGSSAFQWVRTTAVPSVDLENLLPTGSYFFRVRAVNAAGEGAWSDEYGPVTLREVTQPGAPTILGHTLLGDTSLLLEWEEPSDTGGDNLAYEVELRAGTSPWQLQTITPFTSVQVDNLVPSAEYLFRVRAKNGSGPGAWSDEYGPVTLQGLSKPGTPTGLTHSTLSDTSLTLAWEAPEDAGGGPLTYEVAQKVGLSAFNLVTTTSETSIDITGLQPTGAYMWRVRALNGGPAPGEWSAPYGPVTLREVDPPSEPQDIEVSASGTSNLIVTWRAPASLGGAPVTYDVEYTSDGLWEKHASTTAVSTAITGLSRGVSYSVRVAARNSGGTSGWVYSDLATIPEPGPPLAVDSRTISVALGKVGRLYRGALAWTPPAGEVTSYRVRVKRAGKPWSAWVTYTSGNINLAAPRLTLSKLVRNSRYIIAIQAVNGYGRSPVATSAFTTPRR